MNTYNVLLNINILTSIMSLSFAMTRFFFLISVEFDIFFHQMSIISVNEKSRNITAMQYLNLSTMSYEVLVYLIILQRHHTS